MGYFSDVAIAIYGDEDQMTAFIAATRLKDNVSKVFSECEIYPYQQCFNRGKSTKPYIMLFAQFDDVKWYDGNEDVDRWMKFVGLAQQDWIEFINTEFVRVGEDNDDVERQQTGNDLAGHLSVRREVYTDLPRKEEKAL